MCMMQAAAAVEQQEAAIDQSKWSEHFEDGMERTEIKRCEENL